VQRLRNPGVLLSAQQKHALGPGEMSTILLGKELNANLALVDDKARKLAKAEGLEIMGSGVVSAYLKFFMPEAI
jgi:predicted nucleic acid-binding protein